MTTCTWHPIKLNGTSVWHKIHPGHAEGHPDWIVIDEYAWDRCTHLRHFAADRHGQIQGCCHSYAPDGQVASAAEYINGVKHGIEYTVYPETGKIHTCVRWVYGVQDKNQTQVHYRNGHIRMDSFKPDPNAPMTPVQRQLMNLLMQCGAGSELAVSRWPDGKIAQSGKDRWLQDGTHVITPAQQMQWNVEWLLAASK